jgi:hypothetical protein
MRATTTARRAESDTTGQSLSAVDRLPSATATDARGGLHSSRVTQRSISQRRQFYVVAATNCCPGSVVLPCRDQRGCDTQAMSMMASTRMPCTRS